MLKSSHNTKLRRFQLKPESVLSNFVDIDVNETTKLATLKHTDSKIDLTKHIAIRFCKIAKTGTYHINAKNSLGIYPTYSGLTYTSDNKLLLADSNYGMICLVNDTYAHLASYNCTEYVIKKTENDSAKNLPFSATFLGDDIVAASVPEKKTIFIIKADRNLKIQAEIDMFHSVKAVVGLNNGDIAVSLTDPVAFGIVSFKSFHPEEKSYFNCDKSGRVLKSFDYMAVDIKKSHVIQPCSVDKAVFCFDFQGNPKFEYRHTELKKPAGVGIDASGNVYVCDTANDCIHILSPNGYPVSLYKDGCPKNPLALAFDKGGTTFAISRGYKDYYDKERKVICVYCTVDGCE